MASKALGPGSVPPNRPDAPADVGHRVIKDRNVPVDDRARPERGGGEKAGSAVPDILAPGLRLVLVGINPGHASAAAAAHFANPRNDFWRLLHASGLTPRLLEPGEQRELPGLAIGITNAALRTTAGSGDLRAADFEGSAVRLEGIARELRPAVMGFVGKEAYRGAFGERPALGLQVRRLGDTQLFVLPSTSPANAAVPWAERLRWFRELAALLDQRLAALPDEPRPQPRGATTLRSGQRTGGIE